MKHMNLRNTLSIAALIGGTIVAASALADPSQGRYGPGYGMMGGYGHGSGNGYGMGPGMMGGYGQGSGYGMGPEMMGGYGMGSGVFGGYGPGTNLNLTGEQRGKIAKIQNEVRRKHWDLMGKMQEEQSQMSEQYNSETRDDTALSKSYRKMSELRHQMFDLSLDARKQIDTLLTKEQRAKQRGG